MKVTLKRINDQFLFEGSNANGKTVLLDNTSLPDAQGISPMENLLLSVAGCSGIDVIAILKKQRQEITHFSATVEAERRQVDEAKPFSKIMVTFSLQGQIAPIKARRAAELSFAKYCSVTKSLDPDIEISYQVIVNGAEVSADGGTSD